MTTFGYDRPLHLGARGYLATVTGVETALVAARTILDTTPGDIEFQPEFGSRVRQLLHDPNDAALALEMKTSTADALGRWEKRLKVERAEITQAGRSTTAAITLRPRGTGESRVVEVSSTSG